MTITQVTKLEILTPHPEHKSVFLLSHNPGGRVLLREGKAVHAMGHNPETSKLRKKLCKRSPYSLPRQIACIRNDVPRESHRDIFVIYQPIPIIPEIILGIHRSVIQQRILTTQDNFIP